jgi:hypothetical protein
MVMELADSQLQDRFAEYARAGQPGIPRDELLGYLADAAEALDMIGAKFGLQHLDVKPANLFLTAGRVKVGDYGLVSRLDAVGTDAGRGLTPRYVAPEVLRGSVDPRSDQYSLALVYQELLTGTYPYTGRTPQQLMLQHVSATPDLSGLPGCDRPAVGRALAKDPKDRFGSCLDFVMVLMAADPTDAPALALRRARLSRAPADPTRLSDRHPPPDPTADTGRRVQSGESTLPTLPAPPPKTDPPQGLPPLVAANRRRPPQQPVLTPGPRPGAADPDVRTPAPADPNRPRLQPIRSVVPVARLLGKHAADPPVTADRFAAEVVAAAAGGGYVPQSPGDIGRAADGTWVCQFPSTVAPQLVAYKLAFLGAEWGVEPELPDPLLLVLRKAAPAGLLGTLGVRRAGLEVVVRMPDPSRKIGEVTVTGRVYGSPGGGFARTAENSIPQIIEEIRRLLRTAEDRRKHPRVAADFPVLLSPIHSDGGIDPAIPARCRDVSAGGVCLVTPGPITTRYMYAAFDGVAPTAGLAILVKLIWRKKSSQGLVIGGQFRTDL